MIDNYDEYKDELRADLYMLLDELKRIGSSMVAEIEKFLDATFAQPALHQSPNLQGWIRRVEKVKASACEFQGPQSLQRAPQKKVPQQKNKGARGGAKIHSGTQWRGTQNADNMIQKCNARHSAA